MRWSKFFARKGTFKFFVKNSVSHFEPVWTCDINEKIPLEANQGNSFALKLIVVKHSVQEVLGLAGC